jgi:hypothetical protein
MSYMPSAVIANLLANQLTVGEEVMPREFAVGTSSSPSGFMRVTFWTARKTETITQVRMITSSAAAAATPTLCRMGIVEMVDGVATMIAATDNDTTLFSATNTAYTRSLLTPFQKVAGRRYGGGALVVSATTTPVFSANTISNPEAGMEPAISLVWTGLADFPANGVALTGPGIANGARPYVAVLP